MQANEEIIADFIMETEELISGFEKNLIELEKSPDDKEKINEIFRSVHTMKGMAAFLELFTFADLTHKIESFLKKLKENSARVDQGAIELLFESLDNLRAVFDGIKKGNNEEVDISGIMLKIDRMMEHPELAGLREQVNSVGEKEGHSGAAARSKADSVNNAGHFEITESSPETVRVDVEKLNNLINYIGELVTDRAALEILAKEIGNKKLSVLTGHISKIVTGLRNLSLRLRMLPVSNVFKKFPRLVRDLAKSLSRQVELSIHGGNTEIDKSILEEIYEPLLHLVRNAVDHGIESPEERVRKGKNPAGKISLRAYHRDNHVVIEVSDDGRGISKQRILERALELGIVTEEESTWMDEKAIMNLIFLPGFSSKSEATQVSGRGVGMDIVKKRVEELHGSVTFETRENSGTVFTLKFPMTLSIMQALILKVRDERYAVPLVSVAETIQVRRASIEKAGNQMIYFLRGQPVRIFDLALILGAPGRADEPDDPVNIVIIYSGRRRTGLIVDGFMGKQEVVIKSIGGYIKTPKCILGGAILGSGNVIIVLEASSLVERLSGGME